MIMMFGSFFFKSLNNILKLTFEVFNMVHSSKHHHLVNTFFILWNANKCIICKLVRNTLDVFRSANAELVLVTLWMWISSA